MLRRILGPRLDPDSGFLRIRTNEEVRRSVRFPGQLYITSVIKSRRLRWAEHVGSAPPTRLVRRILDNRPISPLSSGRPQLWQGKVSTEFKQGRSAGYEGGEFVTGLQALQRQVNKSVSK